MSLSQKKKLQSAVAEREEKLGGGAIHSANTDTYTEVHVEIF